MSSRLKSMMKNAEKIERRHTKKLLKAGRKLERLAKDISRRDISLIAGIANHR